MDKELKKIKLKMGNSVKKEELQAEFDKAVDKKYGEHALREALEEITKTIDTLEIGKMTLDVKESKL